MIPELSASRGGLPPPSRDHVSAMPTEAPPCCLRGCSLAVAFSATLRGCCWRGRGRPGQASPPGPLVGGRGRSLSAGPGMPRQGRVVWGLWRCGGMGWLAGLCVPPLLPVVLLAVAGSRCAVRVDWPSRLWSQCCGPTLWHGGEEGGSQGGSVLALGCCALPTGLGGAAGWRTGCLHPGLAAGFCLSNLCSIYLLVLNWCCHPLQRQVVHLRSPL